MHSKKSIQSSQNPQSPRSMLEGQKIKIQDPKIIGKPQFPFLPQTKHLFYEMFTKKIADTSQISFQHSEDLVPPQANSARYQREKKIQKFATIDITTMFKSQESRPKIKNLKFGIDNSANSKIQELYLNNRRFISQKKHMKSDESSPQSSQKHLQSIKKNKKNLNQSINMSIGKNIPTKLEKINTISPLVRQTQSSFSKNSDQIQKNCFNKFCHRQKAMKQMNKSLNATNLGLMTNRNHFEQLQRLKMTLYNRKLQQKQKSLNKKGFLLGKLESDTIEGKQKYIQLRKTQNIFASTNKKKINLGPKKKEIGQNLLGSKCEPWENELGDSNFWENYY